jgi:poly(beta-D-mannuronate) lyase
MKIGNVFKLALALGIGTAPVLADTVTVNSVSALQSAVNGAPAGRTILVVNGVYTFGSRISINRVGTASQPIVISAQTVGGVEIRGAGGFTFSSPAAYVTLRGFVFKHAAGTISIPVGAHHCRLTRNVFELTGNTYLSYLSIPATTTRSITTCSRTRISWGR